MAYVMEWACIAVAAVGLLLIISGILGWYRSRKVWDRVVIMADEKVQP